MSQSFASDDLETTCAEADLKDDIFTQSRIPHSLKIPELNNHKKRRIEIIDGENSLYSWYLCAILPDWHSTTFRRRKKERLKALLTKKHCEGGSEYSGIVIFKISIGRRIFLRNTKNGHFD